MDWVETEYSAELVQELADAISRNPHPIETRTATGAPAVWSTTIESLLRKVAVSPAVLTALIHRRPTPPGRVVGFNRAVHFHVQMELNGRRVKDARDAVAKAWRVSDGQIKDDVAANRVDSR